MDGRGRQVEGHVGIGPFKEGDSITLECHVPGGQYISLKCQVAVCRRSVCYHHVSKVKVVLGFRILNRSRHEYLPISTAGRLKDENT